MVQKEHQASKGRKATLDYQAFLVLKDYVENAEVQELQDFQDKRGKKESQ